MVTVAQVRKLALAMPDAVESSHFDVADFRIGKRIFATIHPSGKMGALLRLDPDQRVALAASEPDAFRLQGSALIVMFAKVSTAAYRHLLAQAHAALLPANSRRPSAASSRSLSAAGAARAPARRAPRSRHRGN